MRMSRRPLVSPRSSGGPMTIRSSSSCEPREAPSAPTRSAATRVRLNDLMSPGDSHARSRDAGGRAAGRRDLQRAESDGRIRSSSRGGPPR